jgi:hypothetical protein
MREPCAPRVSSLDFQVENLTSELYWLYLTMFLLEGENLRSDQVRTTLVHSFLLAFEEPIL